jgi:phosphoribosylglycinamide formyltransferase-1
MSPLSVVVLISGNGSNLQALIDSANAGMPFQIAGVISSRADVYGLQRAQTAGIATCIIDHRQFQDRLEYDRALASAIDTFSPELIVMAGFMRILSAEFVRRFRGRMLNIHPSLLPKFRGLHTHRRAIEEGEVIHGASVHFVTEELDGGPVITQALVTIEADDTPAQLAARVLQREHLIYPLTVKWFAERRLLMSGQRILLDNQPLASPITFDYRQPL